MNQKLIKTPAIVPTPALSDREKEVIKEHGEKFLPLYRSLKSCGDSHRVAMDTIAGEKLMANFNR